MKNKVNGRLDNITTTKKGVHKIFEIVVKFVLFQMAKTSLNKCIKFNS